MEVMSGDFHSLWNLPTAIKIAQALEEFRAHMVGDHIKMDDLGALAEFAASTRARRGQRDVRHPLGLTGSCWSAGPRAW